MRSLEESILTKSNRLLDRAVAELAPSEDRNDARLDVLEIVAATYAGWNVEDYWRTTQGRTVALTDRGEYHAGTILKSINATEIPVPLALAALAREALSSTDQRKTGAYYTDWRLAQMLAGSSVHKVTSPGPWIDLACGSGILLVAAVMALAPSDRDAAIRDRLCGADLSPRALRGALLAVSSLTTDLGAVERFQTRLVLGDSLHNQSRWQQLAPSGFALVIGNPPWERLRVSRHETAAANGDPRHYGQRFDTEVDLRNARAEIVAYIDNIAGNARLQGKGEHDLYKLFLELALGVAAEDGIVAQLVPAGLIRSQGTEALRAELDALTRELTVFVLENRQRHFAIDSRFKFLAVIGRIGSGRRQPVMLHVADRTGTPAVKAVKISRTALRQVRRDLSLPEVRTDQEWRLFSRLSASGHAIGDPLGPWMPRYQRELDMTNDRRSFEPHQPEGTIPVIEGRHVSQFRSRAKAYAFGEGRAAIWEPQDLRTAILVPQWSVRPERIRERAWDAASRSRVGFCDITGQTNERSLLVARIPAGVVCGNKVPTLSFSSGGADREDLFIALANSLVVDWMLRRLVTTTVNFFLLNSLPMPPVTESSKSGSRILDLSRQVSNAEGNRATDLWSVAEWRAEIDARTAASWGIGLADMRLIMQDFPLLDRGQVVLPGESRSTVTHDLVISTLAELLGEENNAEIEIERVRRSRVVGAIPYVPAEHS